jgi:hypothetical protein
VEVLDLEHDVTDLARHLSLPVQLQKKRLPFRRPRIGASDSNLLPEKLPEGKAKLSPPERRSDQSLVCRLNSP